MDNLGEKHELAVIQIGAQFVDAAIRGAHHQIVGLLNELDRWDSSDSEWGPTPNQPFSWSGLSTAVLCTSLLPWRASIARSAMALCLVMVGPQSFSPVGL